MNSPTKNSAQPPSSILFRQNLLSALGVAIVIGTLACFIQKGSPILIGSFGASSMLLFCFELNPQAQPRNIIGGHFLTSLIALTIFYILGTNAISLSLALFLSIFLMLKLRIPHSPAASNPIIIFLSHAPIGIMGLFSILLGTISLVLFALLYNRFVRKVTYPLHW